MTDASWEEFARRCAENVQKIRATSDEGLYAKLYADDVARLLSMLSVLRPREDLRIDLIEKAFDETRTSP